MLKMTATVCIDASPAQVWAILSDFGSIHLWVEPIQRSHCPGRSRGVGAVRVCELKQATIQETVVEWDEGRSFTYRGDGLPLMKSAINSWSVQACGEQTLVTSSAAVEMKGGWFGRCLLPLMKPFFARMGAQSLAALKYFVENGQPYRGKIRDLPAARALC